MSAILSSDAGAQVGSSENLQYSPPAGSTLVGGLVSVGLYADGYGEGASGTAVAYSPAFAYDGSDVFFQCAHGLTPCGNGTNDFGGELALPANRGGNFYVGAGCGGIGGQFCAEGGSNGAWSLVQVWWANFLLTSDATPAASGVGGGLLGPNARGTQDLTLVASDPGGPGVYAIRAEVDGQTLYSGTPDSNGGKCAPVGVSGGALMFDYSQPCRQSESVDLPIDTASVADGQHTLKVTVQDAAQNASVVYDGTITTSNAPVDTSPPTITAPSQVSVGGVLSAHPGAWSAPSGAGSITYGYQWQGCDAQGNNCQAIAGAQDPSYAPAPSDVGRTLRVLVTASNNDGLASAPSAATGAVPSSQGPSGGPGAGGGNGPNGVVGSGAPNGTVASETAQLLLGVRHAISRPYARRAFRLTGRLLGGQSLPIGGASLDVLQQIAGSNTLRVIWHTRTRGDGSFVIGVPGGPSRLVEVGYRAFSNDANYATQATIRESVGAGVQLNVTPRRTSSTGPIVLSGRVLAPIPPQGAIVDLLVHYRGRWEPFRTPRTDSQGHFQVVYQFEGGIGRFPFRAEVPTGQASFPFSDGFSNVVDVVTG